MAQGQQAGQSQRAAINSAWSHVAPCATGPSALPAPAALAAFVQTPEDVAWLRQMLVAEHWSIGEQGGAGVLVLCNFLVCTVLSAFIGASYGT